MGARTWRKRPRWVWRQLPPVWSASALHPVLVTRPCSCTCTCDWSLGHRPRLEDNCLGGGLNIGPVGVGASAGLGHGNFGFSGGLGWGGDYSNYGSPAHYQQYH